MRAWEYICKSVLKHVWDDSYIMVGCASRNDSFSCGLDSGACVHILLAQVFVYVCVCGSSSQCVSWSTAGSVRPPALPARCAHVFVTVACVCE